MTAATNSTEPVSVLIVEDDALAAKSLTYLLQHYGYQVQVARDVRQAVKLLDSKPQIILLDLMLPDGDGTFVMETVKARKLSTKVFVVTGVTSLDRLQKVQTLKPQQLLPKPLNFLNLLDQMRNHAA